MIFNPSDGPCIGFYKPAVGVDNQTDTGATLYTGLACSGVTAVVPARTGITWGTYRPNSVRFGSIPRRCPPAGTAFTRTARGGKLPVPKPAALPGRPTAVGRARDGDPAFISCGRRSVCG